jgi:hypothetical protein
MPSIAVSTPPQAARTAAFGPRLRWAVVPSFFRSWGSCGPTPAPQAGPRVTLNRSRLSARFIRSCGGTFLLGRAQGVPRYSVQVSVRTLDQQPRPLAVGAIALGARAIKRVQCTPLGVILKSVPQPKLVPAARFRPPDYFGVSNTACSLPLGLLASQRI